MGWPAYSRCCLRRSASAESSGRRDQSGVRGWFAVNYRGGGVARVEKTLAAGAGLTLEGARKEARALGPDDSAPTGTATSGGDPVDLYASPSLAGRFRDQGKDDLSRFHVRYKVANGQVVSYALAVGPP